MYTLVAVSGLLSPSAFVRLPEMRISVLHKGHSILFHLLDFISVFAPQKPVLAAPMAYWSRHLLAWLIARRQAAGACGRGLHPRGFATPHLQFTSAGIEPACSILVSKGGFRPLTALVGLKSASISLRETARPVICSANISAYPVKLRLPGPRGQNPGPLKEAAMPPPSWSPRL